MRLLHWLYHAITNELSSISYGIEALTGTATDPLCNKLATLEVMISIRQNLRFHYGYDPVLEEKNNNQEKTGFSQVSLFCQAEMTIQLC